MFQVSGMLQSTTTFGYKMQSITQHSTAHLKEICFSFES